MIEMSGISNVFGKWSIRLAIVVLGLLIVSCVQFKPATFYTGEVRVPPPERPERISRVVEPLIYKDDDRDVWGIEKDECKEVSLSKDIVQSGHSAIKLRWDRNAEGCTWAGIGIGWDGYVGKDLSAVMDHAAISMYVRTIEGRSFGLPFVLTLEDYSGGMGFCYTGNKYFERIALDEEWQQVIVPLADFDIETENLDVSNIKQLQIELQQSGAVYLDNIELIFHTPEEREPWLEEEKLPDPLALPVVLFKDEFINNNGWGLISDHCQRFELSKDDFAVGKQSIYAKWDATGDDCHLNQFGVSWNRWHPTDITPIIEKAAIRFQIKMIQSAAGEDISIRVGFEDYDRGTTHVLVQNSHSLSGLYGPQWTTVLLPLKLFPTDADLKRIKHLYFEFIGTGECYIDDIQIVAVDKPVDQ